MMQDDLLARMRAPLPGEHEEWLRQDHEMWLATKAALARFQPPPRTLWNRFLDWFLG